MRDAALFLAIPLALLLYSASAAPERGALKHGPSQMRTQRSTPYAVPANRTRPNELREHQAGPSRDSRAPNDPWQLPSTSRRPDQIVRYPPSEPPQHHRASTRWCDMEQGNGERPTQRGPPRAPQPSVIRENQRVVTSAPEVHLPAAVGHLGSVNGPTRRFFSPQPAPQRRLTPEEIRERHNQEARRTVAVNTWQPYLRERVLTLGYRVAGEIWVRTNTFNAGRFTVEEVEEHGQYARWIRDTLLGFERYYIEFSSFSPFPR